MPTHRDLDVCGSHLVVRCREMHSPIFQFKPAERGFLERVNDHSEACSDLVTDDSRLQQWIATRLALHWEARNARKFHEGDS